MLITPHFSGEEFTHSNTAELKHIPNDPNLEQYANLHRVADVLEKARVILGNKSITVTSGFRSEELNKAVGGVHDSAHLHGLAADIECFGFGSAYDVYEELKPHVVELGIDQLIVEHDSHDNTWVHIGLSVGPPRNQCLTLEKN